MSDATVARHIAAALARHGVRRMFGVPGGGSSLDLIEAAADLGIEFVLTRNESAALMMAAATAELSGTPGVAITTKGPGTANGTNGFAYAAIDRAPLVLLTDGFTAAETAFVTHQVFDQQALLAPLAKGAGRLEGEDAADEFEALLKLALTPPFGPVLVELTSEAAKNVVRAVAVPAPTHASAADPAPGPLDAARSLLVTARRPVLILGLESRSAVIAAAVRRLAESLACPVLVTYKAMGVMPDAHPQFIGGFISGVAEYETVSRADLILLVGFDPVELLRQCWRYSRRILTTGTDCQHKALLSTNGPTTTSTTAIWISLAEAISGRIPTVNRFRQRKCQRSIWCRRGARNGKHSFGITPTEPTPLTSRRRRCLTGAITSIWTRS